MTPMRPARRAARLVARLAAPPAVAAAAAVLAALAMASSLVERSTQLRPDVRVASPPPKFDGLHSTAV